MSEALDYEPTRGRQPRAEAVAGERRRRRNGSLNVMAQFKLDIFGPEDLDLENFVYLWANDEGANIRSLTQQDDYEFVTSSDIRNFNPNMVDSAESDERIRILAGNKKNGDPLYVYYLKKPRSFWEEDQEAIVRRREDMMAGRVYRAEATEDSEQRPGGADNFYATRDSTIGHAAQRRRGPVPRNLK